MPSIFRLSRRLLAMRWLGYFLLLSRLCYTVAWAQRRSLPIHPNPQPIVSLLAMTGPGDPNLAYLLPRLDSIRQQALHKHDGYVAAYCQLMSLRSRLVYANQLAQGRRLLEQARPSNVQAQVVRLGSPVDGTDSYVELSFPGSSLLINPQSSLGYIDFRLLRSDNGLFDQTNDYSYAPNYGNVGLNDHVTAYLNNNLVFGTLPSGASARVGTSEPVSALSVRVLGNPVVGSSAQVEIKGVEGQAVSLRLVDLQGRSVHEQRIEQAAETEQVSVPLGQSRGTLLLRVNTATQQLALKLVRP